MERQTSSSMVSTWLTVTSMLLFITEAVSSAHGNVKPKTIPSAQYTWTPAITHGYQTSTIASFANPFDATAVVGSATDKPVTDDRRLKTEPADPCKAAAYLGDIALTEDELDLIGRGLLLPTASTAIPTKSRSAAAARRTSKRRRPKSPSVVTSNDDVNAVTGVNLPSSRDGHRPPARRESRGRSSSTTSEWTSHDSVTREPILRTSTQSTANRQVRGQSSDTTLGWFSPTMSTSSMAEWTTRETEVFGDDLRSERDQNRRTKHVRPAHAPMQRPTATSGDVDHQDHHRKKGRRRTTAQPPDGTFDAIRHANGRRSDKNAPSPGSVKTRTTTIGTEQQHHRQRRAATARPERLWDHGVIPYEIEANFSGAHKALFKQAMRHWENYTCISFVERTQDDPNYILFTERPCGCCSFVGKRGNGPQAISIGKNCDKFGIVVHELGHVVGFWHEHTRPDRDDHVQIVFKNIMPGQEYNFNTLTSAEVNSLNESYDFASIMHYARNTFAKATYLDTIMPRRDPSTSSRPEIGQRINLSQGDITQANKLYRCPRCGRTLQDSSGSFGYPWPSSPEAQSPAGSTGSDVVHPWAHTTVGDAARVSVMAAGMAPDQVPAACQWRISGTHGEKIVINVTALSLAASDCATDYLEIRDGHWYKSPLIVRYCTASTQQIKFPVTVTSSDSRVWIEYRSSSSLSSNRLGPSVFQAKYEAVCGGEIVKESGILSSPNYPDIYKPNKECVWKVTVPEGYSVALKFQSFEIESHENCVYDYVELRDGHEDGARVIGKYCGNKMPGDVKSTGNKLYIKFVSDASVQKPGFAATFMKEFDECLTDTHGCHHQCVNTLGSFQCKCNIGYELHSDGRRCEDACGGYINAANGTIQSPSFPELYPQNKNCVWQIVAPDQYRITINFTHFDLEGNNQDCDYDKVELRSGFETDDKVHGTYCGSTVPQPMTSEGSRLRVTFVTDNSVQKSGFSAVFFTDKDECAVDNGGCQHVCKNTVGSYKCSCHTGYILHDDGHGCKEGGCQHEISKPVGELLSPNWPDYYPSRKDCTWHLSTTAGHRIKLTFNEFEVEPHEECTYDRLEVYDGDDSNAPRLNRMCGSGLPAPLLSSANRMFLTFYSDASVQKKGFHITHTTVCGGDLVATSKASYLYSHAKHGDHNYDNKENCEWRIVANDTSHRIRFRFLTFEVEDEPDCGYDVVEIYDISTRSPQLLKKYCSHEIPPDVISLGNQLLVRFKTDDTITYKGFSAAFVLAGPDTLPPAPSRSSNGNGGSSISSSVRGSGGSLTAGTLSAKNAAVSPGGRGSGSSYAGIGTRSVVSPVMTGLVETRSKLKPGTTTMTSSSDTHGSNSGGSSGGVHNQRVHRGDGLTPRRSQGHSRHRDGSGTRSKRQRVTSGSSSSSAA